MSDSTQTREVALSILLDVYKNEMPMHQALTAWLTKFQYLDKQDRSLISHIVRTVVENQLWIDGVLNHYSSVKVNKMKPVIRNIMRMGVAQLLFMEMPDHAVCNESVNLAVRKGFKGLKGFVNGVLRQIARNRATAANEVLPDESKDLVGYLSMRYSMPEWIVSDWMKHFGKNQARLMIEDSMKPHPTMIRVNTLKTSKEALKKRFVDLGIHVEDGAWLPFVLKISGYDHLQMVEGFEEGLFFVQDESSALAGALSGVKEGDHVIDVCAAPGGKSMNLAMLMNGKGSIESRDLTYFKTDKIQENIMRLDLSMIDVKQADATIYDESAFESADVVIADLPCSGLGVIGRKSDIKYRMTPKMMAELVKLQKDILENVWRYVKPGGILLYSTCTVNPDENINQVREFLKNHPFEMESLDRDLPKVLHSETTKEGYLQLLPGVFPCDGFFMARLRKKV